MKTIRNPKRTPKYTGPASLEPLTSNTVRINAEVHSRLRKKIIFHGYTFDEIVQEALDHYYPTPENDNFRVPPPKPPIPTTKTK